MPEISATDHRFLERALELAERGWGRVHPNPMVGCVLTRGGEIVGEGWHREFGEAHAEVEALSQAGLRARGSTAYVSLEPCRHQGKTPPCTEALLEAGVTRVIFAAEDPWAVSGGGADRLREVGIEVIGPVLEPHEARRRNPAFFHRRDDRPFVTLKLALSLDGRLAEAPGAQTRISGPEADRAVQRLRAGYDAILVGTRTVQVDDPRLTVRGEVTPRIPPVRMILDARGVVDPRSRVFDEHEAPVWVITGRQPEEGWAARVRDRGADIVSVPLTSRGRIDLSAALQELRGRGIRSLLCEGGGVLGTALLQSDFVDRLILIVSPSFLGADGVSAFPDLETDSPSNGGSGWTFAESPRLMGKDLWCVLDRGA